MKQERIRRKAYVEPQKHVQEIELQEIKINQQDKESHSLREESFGENIEILEVEQNADLDYATIFMRQIDEQNELSDQVKNWAIEWKERLLNGEVETSEEENLKKKMKSVILGWEREKRSKKEIKRKLKRLQEYFPFALEVYEKRWKR